MANRADWEKGESFLLAELKARGHRVLVEKDSMIPRYAASVSKVFLAAEFIKLLEQAKTLNKEIEIKDRDIVGYGTDVLADLVGKKNLIRIDALTLVGLMLKYSCNSSGSILAKYFLPDRKTLQRVARETWGLKNSRLIDKNGKQLNYFSLRDFLIIFQKIYSQKGRYWKFLGDNLKTSRNIYYLFDQQELEILGSKSGTKRIGKTYYVHDCGIFKLNGKKYFIAATVLNQSISKAVLKIREIGKQLVSSLQK